MALETPVVLLFFNRLEPLERVFQRVAQAKPKKLLLVADGPRAHRPGEDDKCRAARAIAERIDWDCEVLKNYSETNLGCGKRVSSGIDWAFSLVEEAIILEDDCLPAPGFFDFCAELLEHYRDDERITSITGTNLQKGPLTPYSYHFSKYNTVWGWATWRRAWRHYDFEMKYWPEIRDAGVFMRSLHGPEEYRYWACQFDKVRAGEIDTWDYQWLFSCWAQNGISVVPEINLVTNIGFGTDATHTVDVSSSSFFVRPTGEIGPVTHPPYVLRHEAADNYVCVNALTKRSRSSFIKEIVRRLSSIFRRNSVKPSDSQGR